MIEIREVQRNPVVQQARLRIDRVWKGDVSRTFDVLNLPVDWMKTIVVQTPNGASISGGPPGYRPFQPNQSHVVVARRLTFLGRRELGIGSDEEGRAVQ